MKEKLKEILATYRSEVSLPEEITILVAFPKTPESNNDMDLFCIEALKELCPKATIRTIEYDWENWGIDTVELRVADHIADEKREESGLQSIEETVRGFFDQVATACFGDEVEFRAKRRRDRRETNGTTGTKTYEEQVKTCFDLYCDMQDKMDSLSTALRDLALLSLGTEKESVTKFFRDKIVAFREESSWPPEIEVAKK